MKKVKKIIAVALAAVLLLTAGGLAFAGNYLFRFALDPEAGGMISRSDPEAVTLEGDSAWFAEGSEDRWLESHDGLKLHALYLPQEGESHKYAVICHGYGSIPQYGGRFAAHFYEMGYSVLAPAARAHERSLGGHDCGAGPPGGDRAVRRLHGRGHGDDDRRGGGPVPPCEVRH